MAPVTAPRSTTGPAPATVRRACTAPPRKVDLVPALGTARKLQSLVYVGWTRAELARRLDCRIGWVTELLFTRRRHVTRETWARVDELYRRLCMTPGPSLEARDFARAQGWRSALYWDDIETDEDHALRDRAALPDTEPDEIAVELVCNRELDPRRLRPVDLRAALARLCAGPLTVHEVTEILHVAPRTVDRHRARLREARRREEFASALVARGRTLAGVRDLDAEHALPLGLAHLLAVAAHLTRPARPRYELTRAIPAPFASPREQVQAA